MNCLSGAASAACVPASGTGTGQVLITGKVQINLSIAESHYLIERRLSGSRFVVAHWNKDEPIIHGEGDTRQDAVRMAFECLKDSHRYYGVELEVHELIPGQTCVWRGPSGRVITSEHFRTLDN